MSVIFGRCMSRLFRPCLAGIILFYLLLAGTAWAASPQINLDPGNAAGVSPDFAAQFIEGGTPVAVSAPDALITDSDSYRLTGLTAAITDMVAGDVLAAVTSGTSVTAVYNGGILRLTGSDTVGNYQAVLRSITFENTSRNLSPLFRHIRISADDETGTGEVRTATIAVFSVNDPPEVDLDPSAAGSGYVRSFDGATGTIRIASPEALITDPDHSQLSGMTIFLAVPQAGDLLEANTDGTGISVSGSNSLLTLTGTDTIANYVQVLRSITLTYNTTTPDRIIAVMAHDGRSASAAALAVIATDTENPAVAKTSRFVEDKDPVKIAGDGATLSGDDITGLTITAHNMTAEDILTADTSGTAISSTYSGGVLQLTGADTAANYQTVLRSITFSNSSQNPALSFRAFEFKVLNGIFSGNPATTVLSVIPVNDAPVNTVPGPQVTPRNIPLIFSTSRNNLMIIADADAGENPVQTTLEASSGTLNPAAVADLQVTGSGSAKLVLTGTLARINMALNGLSYTPVAGWHGKITLTLTTDDQGYSGDNGPKTDTDTVEITVAVTTAPAPVADAGTDRTVNERTLVTLDGSASYARNGEALAAHAWTQTGGPSVTLAGVNTATASFTAPEVGTEGATLVFRLTVTDSSNVQTSDTVTINVANIPESGLPTANAGPDQSANESTFITLDGSGSVPATGATIVTYAWTQTSGTAVTLSGANTASPSFTAPEVGTGGTILTFRLTVTDSNGNSASDTVNVQVSDTSGTTPVEVTEGDTVILDGTGSVSNVTAYAWQQISGPTVSLSDPAAAKPSFVAPVTGSGGAELVFQVTLTFADGTTQTRLARFTIQDNGIQGYPDNVLAFKTVTNATMGILISGGQLVSLKVVDPATIQETENRPESLIYGLIDMQIRVSAAGDTATVTVYLENPAAEGMSWFKYFSGSGWSDYGANAFFSADRRQVTITLTDGGTGDDDETADSMILDPSGPGAKTDTNPSGGDGDDGGGGCFFRPPL